MNNLNNIDYNSWSRGPVGVPGPPGYHGIFYDIFFIPKEYTRLLFDGLKDIDNFIAYESNFYQYHEMHWLQFGKNESRKSRWKKMKTISNSKTFLKWISPNDRITRKIKLIILNNEISRNCKF
jgi:hypothetical protein